MKHTNHRFLPTPLKGLSATDFVGIIITCVFVGTLLQHPAYAQTHKTMPESRPTAKKVYSIKPACELETVVSQNKCLIHMYAERYGVETETALRIAECESQYGKYQHNTTGSTAKGVYQFIDSTWEYTGGGDVLDPHQNIERFMQFYPTNPTWWECV